MCHVPADCAIHATRKLLTLEKQVIDGDGAWPMVRAAIKSGDGRRILLQKCRQLGSRLTKLLELRLDALNRTDLRIVWLCSVKELCHEAGGLRQPSAR
jgi:hypothetical protein